MVFRVGFWIHLCHWATFVSVWLPDSRLYSNSLHSLGIPFCAQFGAQPAVQQHLLKKQASKHQETKFHKITDFKGTAHVFCHSCRNVYSMIFALRTRKTRIYCFHGFPGYCILYTKRSISHQWWMPQWPESETWICNSSNHDQLQRTMITSRWTVSDVYQYQINGQLVKCQHLKVNTCQNTWYIPKDMESVKTLYVNK